MKDAVEASKVKKPARPVNHPAPAPIPQAPVHMSREAARAKLDIIVEDDDD